MDGRSVGERTITFLPITSEGKRVYAGFWKRFCAVLIDYFVTVPLAIAFIWLDGLGKNVALLTAIPSLALFAMYHVYFNARFGGTVGKLAVGIRITKPDGTRIGWAEAWKRSAVDLVFASIMLVLEVLALTQVGEADYSAAGHIERMALLRSLYPAWHSAVQILQEIWIWSEVVVLLFNPRKRAIHDFIAGTVVVHKEFATPSAAPDC